MIGRVAGKGLADELSDRGYLIVDGIDGRAHYVRLPDSVDFTAFAAGAIVEVGGSQPRPADRTIEQLAQHGVYRTDEHLHVLREQNCSATSPEAIVEAHVRRLDRQLLAGSPGLAADGFGAEVRKALSQRAEFLVEERLAERRGQRISGTYRRSVDLVSGRYAVLDDTTGFSLVPWMPVIEKRLGQSMTAVMQGGRASWEFGRQRGLSL